MRSAPYKVDIITDPADLFALGDEWDRLYQGAERPYPSQGYEWARGVWETMAAPQDRRLHCVVVRNAGRVVLIWPFLVVRQHRFWTAAVPLAGPGDYHDILTEASSEAPHVAGLALRSLRETCGTDLIRLTHVRSDSLLYKSLAAEGALPLWGEPSPYVEWSGYPDWDAYWRSIGRNARAAVDRRNRRLSELGDVSFELITEGERYRQTVTWMLRQKWDWFSRKGHVSSTWLGSHTYEALLASAADRITSHGRIVIFALLLDGRPVAVQVAWVDAWRVIFKHSAYDYEYAKHSPGSLLTKRVLRWAFDNGLSCDFLHGAHEYKLTYSTASSDIAVFNVACTGWGRVHELLKAFVRASKTSKAAGVARKARKAATDHLMFLNPGKDRKIPS